MFSPEPQQSVTSQTDKLMKLTRLFPGLADQVFYHRFSDLNKRIAIAKMTDKATNNTAPEKKEKRQKSKPNLADSEAQASWDKKCAD